MRLGAHLPTSHGLVWTARRARRLRLDCLQLFVRNPRGWRSRTYPSDEVAEFRALLRSQGIAPVFVHSCYLVNLASPDRELLARSRHAVADDIARAALLGAQAVVFHMGHHMGAGISAGLRTLAQSLRTLLSELPDEVSLIVENAAGRGTELGGDWAHFRELFDLLAGDHRVGICLDTCHAHAAGYRLDGRACVSRSLRQFREALALPPGSTGPLALVHLNDCAAPPGEHIDLHQHIGRGTIGDRGFRALLKRRELRALCGILETPMRRPHDDVRNLRRLRRLAA